MLMLNAYQFLIRNCFASQQLNDVNDFVEFLVRRSDDKIIAIFGLGIGWCD